MSIFTIRVTASATNAAGTAYGQQPDLGTPSFLDLYVTNSTDPSLANGRYDAYCLNPLVDIFLSPTTYSAEEYAGNTAASFVPIGLNSVTQTQVDQINWLLAQNFTSDAKFAGQYNFGEVQTAIWKLVGFTDAQIASAGLTLFVNDNNRNVVTTGDINFLVSSAQAAVASGAGVVPGDTYFSTIIDPAGNVQPLIVQLQSAKLGNYVWNDANANGIQDASEVGVDSVVVELWKNGNLVASTVTGDDFSTAAVEHGFYQFAGLGAGDYQVRFVAPTGSQFTTADVNSNNQNSVDSDANALGFSQAVTLVAGQSDQTIDAGLVTARATLSGVVYADNNVNNLLDGSDVRLLGVQVALFKDAAGIIPATDANGNQVAATATDLNGNYSFANLPAGTYYVKEVQPAGYLENAETLGTQGGAANPGGANDVIQATLSAGQNGTGNNFGEILPARLSGYVYEDFGNDGVRGNGEPAIGGVTVLLTGNDAQGASVNLSTVTNAAGFYEFTGLVPGIYAVTEVQPGAYLDGKDTAGSKGGDVTLSNDVIAHVVLAAGDNSVNNNFGELVGAQIRGFVYCDDNNDGVKQAGEAGLAGVPVRLQGSNDLGQTVDVTVNTAADGSYIFAGLRPGTYSVIETAQPAGKLDGKDTAGLYGGGVAGNEVISNILLTQGLISNGNNFGELLPASVSGYVYCDTNNDGIKQAGDVGLAGVPVRLTGSNDLGVAVDVTLNTDANGAYSFTGLRPGSYTVTETSQPAGKIDGKETAGSTGGDTTVNDVISGIVVTAGQASTDNNFGELLPATSVINGFVYCDSNNDGIKQAGETGLAGVPVRLTGTNDIGQAVDVTVNTDANGAYSFTGLRAGTYTVTEISQPAGKLDGKETAGSAGGSTAVNDLISNIVLASNQTSTDNNFGEILPARLSGHVYEDVGNDGVRNSEPAIAGVTVALTGTDDRGNAVTASTTTNAAGFYEFLNLRPGSYSVSETQPAYLDGKETAGSTGGSTAVNDVISGITLVSGAASTENNFGELRGADVRGFVYCDANNDGIKQAGDLGLAGVTVTLTGSNDLGASVTATTTTGLDGSYAFTSLRPGNYTVSEPAQPSGKLDGKETAGTAGGNTSVNDVISSIVLTQGQTSTGNNFGETLPASLGNKVWVDLNNDGVQDANEPGVAGVKVSLLDVNGAAIGGPVTTNAAGEYLFGNLAPGAYSVKFDLATLPSGYTVTSKDAGGNTASSDLVDSDADATTGRTTTTVLDPGENDLSWDMGIRATDGIDIEKYVHGEYSLQSSTGGEGLTPGFWKNHTGLTSTPLAGWPETGLTPGTSYKSVFGVDVSAATPTLLDALSSNGGGMFALMRHSAAAILNASDPYIAYAYTKTQIIAMVQQAFVSGDYETPKDLLAKQNELGADLSTPANTKTTLVVTPDVDADSAGSGPVIPVGGTAVFTYVVKNTGTAPLSNVSVTDDRIASLNFVGGDTNSNNMLDVGETWTYKASQTVQAGGQYVNIGTAKGTDKVSGVQVADTDAANYSTTAVSQSLGDRVWLDANANGIQDAGELGVAGVTVQLKNTFNTLLQTTVTDANGNYLFNVAAGNYLVSVVTPAGYGVSAKDQGANDSIDSDIDPTSKTTGTVTVNAGQQNLTVDAGIYQAAAIGDRAWLDGNGNGLQDAGELGLANLTVKLLNAAGSVVATQNTDANGNYLFAGLVPGSYAVQFGTLSGYSFTGKDLGGNDATDSDADPITGKTAYTTLTSGEVDRGWDAGLFRKASVGDKVWEDWNHNDLQDVGEGGIGGIKVKLMDATGTTVLASTTTNSNGNYLFSNLDPGTYVLQFDKSNVTFAASHWGGSYNMSNWKWARNDIGSNDAIDSDVTGDATATTDVTRTSAFKLTSGMNDMSRDAGITPIVIDLDHNGIKTVSRADDSHGFDLFGNGTSVKSGWISGGDGFLAVDKNGNGKIDSISELFGGNAKGAGFASLAAFDSNHDGLVNSLDADFGQLMIWRDANGNHSTDAGELVSLAQAGVASLTVGYTELPFVDAQGNLHLERSSATLDSGASVDMTDVYFNVSADDAAAAGLKLPSMADLLGDDRALDTVLGGSDKALTSHERLADEAGSCHAGEAGEVLRRLAALSHAESHATAG